MEILWLRAGLPDRIRSQQGRVADARVSGARFEKRALCETTRSSLVAGGILSQNEASHRSQAHASLMAKQVGGHLLGLVLVRFLYRDSPAQYLLDHQKAWKHYCEQLAGPDASIVFLEVVEVAILAEPFRVRGTSKKWSGRLRHFQLCTTRRRYQL